jgi:AsmA protein
MGRLLKIILWFVAGIAGLVLVAAVSLFLFFDPNDFRDRISAAVKESTGRDLVVGDISLTVFPWLAVKIGHTELGNATGFSSAQFLSFEEASLSVRIMPLIIRQQIEVGTASLDGLTVNLEVGAGGSTNWDDLAEGDSSSGDSASGDTGPGGDFDVASIAVTNASVSYTDTPAGTGYSVSDLSFETGRIAVGMPIDVRAEFDFDSSADELGGHLAIRGTTTMAENMTRVSVENLNVSGELRGIVAEPTAFNFDARAVHVDTAAESVSPGEMDLSVLGLSMAANVEPFSYSGTPQPVADLRVAEFSLKDLMRTLDIEPPVTADSNALQRVSFSAKAAVGEEDINLTAMSLELDDSVMVGSLSLPMDASGSLGFDLEVDSITLDGYMAPPDDIAAASDQETSDVEIPADLIRTLNVNGSFRIQQAFMTGMEFTNLELGVNASGGKLRLNPLAADFYDGGYSGDVQIDASQDVPFVSTNERISDVNLGTMMSAMYDVDNISGTVNGHFQLQGAGQTLSAIQRDLDGNISIELADGAWEGTDIWHQLRAARAMYRQEPAPEPSLPARTEFSSVSASGAVLDGIFTNNDFLAELPFLQLSGAGMLDLVSTEVDYAMEVRVLDRPEFMGGATEEELADFTSTVVPLKITGLLSAPSVRPDIEGIFRARVEEVIEEKKEELRDQLINRLLGPEDPPPDGEDPEAQDDEAVEEDPEEKLKRDLLKKLFEN